MHIDNIFDLHNPKFRRLKFLPGKLESIDSSRGDLRKSSTEEEGIEINWILISPRQLVGLYYGIIFGDEMEMINTTYTYRHTHDDKHYLLAYLLPTHTHMQ